MDHSSSATVYGRDNLEYHGYRESIRTPQPFYGNYHLGVIESNTGVGLTPELPRQSSSNLFEGMYVNFYWKLKFTSLLTLDWGNYHTHPCPNLASSTTVPDFGISSVEKASGSGPLRIEGPFEAIPQLPSKVSDLIRTNRPSAFTEIGKGGGSVGKKKK